MILKQAIDFEKEPKPTKIGKNLQTGPTTPWSPPQELAYRAHERPCLLVIYIFSRILENLSANSFHQHIFLPLIYIYFFCNRSFLSSSRFSYCSIITSWVIPPLVTPTKTKFLYFDNINIHLLLHLHFHLNTMRKLKIASNISKINFLRLYKFFQ